MQETRTITLSKINVDDVYQVILYNDDYNTCEYVVSCLMNVFGHSYGMAVKLMSDAHNTGKTIAQVESKSEAMKHLAQLTKLGLMATVSKI